MSDARALERHKKWRDANREHVRETSRENMKRFRRANPERTIWAGMLNRCLRKSAGSYKLYGGRGIEVCQRWLKFENFLADMGPRPVGTRGNRSLYSLERIDNDGPYSPENCRWVTQDIQANNTRRNKKIEYMGKTQTVAQWAKALGITSAAMKKRLQRWPLARAMQTPLLR